MKLHWILILIPWASFAQGSFDPPANQSGSKAIHKDSSLIKSWASKVTLVRGYKDIAQRQKGKVNYGKPEYALGKSDNKAVSLGDGGIATITFNGRLFNGVGPDFCVFENAFNHTFLELAFVEVSSNGTDYVRFPSVSETDTSQQIGSFDLLDATDIHNLAGKYKAGFGVPFDLEELKDSARVNIDSIVAIRVVDVVGSIAPGIGQRDSKGNLINDPYPTDFQNNGFYTGGFDLESVGLINYSGEIYLTNPKSMAEQNQGIQVYPNPTNGDLHLVNNASNGSVKVFNSNGMMVAELLVENQIVSLSEFPQGLYFIEVIQDEIIQRVKVLKR